MSQKHYLLVGASSGIGFALASLLTAQGHKISAFSRSQKRLEELPLVDYYPYDVTKEEKLPDLDIDGLVYLPGTIRLKPFRQLKKEDFLEDLSINLFGALPFLHHYTEPMKKKAGASIVFVSTTVTRFGLPFHASINVAKSAVEGLALALAAELAPSIRVNVVSPGLTETPLSYNITKNEERKTKLAKDLALQRLGQAEDIAEMIAFLLSEKASWITGKIFPVDGGFSSVRF